MSAPLYREPARLVLVAATILAADAHVPVISTHLHEAPYMGVLFVLLTGACLVLATAALVTDHPAVPLASIAVCGGAVLGYALTRLTAFPQLADDVGNWWEPLGVVSVLAETVVVLAAAAQLRHGVRRPGLEPHAS